MKLTADGAQAIDALASRQVKSLLRGHGIISEGADPKTVHLITDGWAGRFNPNYLRHLYEGY